jgi:Zn-dependent peptidase ImmA (M78 family)
VPSQTLAYISPDVLRWARESIGFSLEQAAQEVGGGIRSWQIQMVEEGVEYLTLRQAERVAEAYERPLATLFLPEPPQEEPLEAQFRRLPGAPPLPWPPAMRALARRVAERQAAAAELFDALEETPQWAEVIAELRSAEATDLSRIARDRLGITLTEQFSWRDPVGYTPLRAWVDAVEQLGVFVMQDGSMPVTTLRGFAALHPTVPAIVVNTKDDPRARAFTVVHELGHHILAARGNTPHGSDAELWCNEFAGQVLVPTDALHQVYASAYQGDLERRIYDVALMFGVTPLAAAVRVARSELLPRAEADALIARIRLREPAERKPGGNYYRNKVTWLGPAFIRLVLDAADGQALTLSNAAGLLEAKVNQFPTLRARVDERAEFG